MVDGIKPPSGDRPLSDDAASSSVEKSKGREFSLLRGKADETAAAKARLGSLEGYRKADLDDPNKLDSIVRASVSELIEGGCASLGPIPQHDRERVLNSLTESPFIQQQLQSYLSKVLS